MRNQLLLSEGDVLADDSAQTEQTQAALASIVCSSSDAVISVVSTGRRMQVSEMFMN